MTQRFKAVAALLLMIGSQIVSPAFARQAPAQGQTQGSSATPSQTQPGQSASGQGRQLTLAPDYSKGKPWWPHVTEPYRPLEVAQPLLNNSPRVNQLIQGDKLMLSLEDAVSLALENNMDIAVQRFTPWLDETALLRSLSGVNGRLVFDPVLTGHRLYLQSFHAGQ